MLQQGAESYCGDEPEVDPPTLEEWSRAASSSRSGATAIPDGRKSLADDDFGARLSMDCTALRNMAEAEEGVGESGRRGELACQSWHTFAMHDRPAIAQVQWIAGMAFSRERGYLVQDLPDCCRSPAKHANLVVYLVVECTWCLCSAQWLAIADWDLFMLRSAALM